MYTLQYGHKKTGCVIMTMYSLFDGERYSMGGGYYLKDGYRHSSGWSVYKVKKYGESWGDDLYISLAKRCIFK